MIVSLILYLATIPFFPVPFLRGLFFEEVRQCGGWLLLAWLVLFGVTLLRVSLTVSLTRNFSFRILLSLLLSIACIFYLSIPLWPFVGQEDTKTSAPTISILISEGGTTEENNNLISQHSPTFWLAINAPIDESVTDQYFSCTRALSVADDMHSVLYATQACDTMSEISLFREESTTLRVMLSPDIPLFFFRTNRANKPESLYHNHLALRRFTSLLRQYPTAILATQLQASPWSKSYSGLVDGAELHDARWGNTPLGTLPFQFYGLSESLFVKGNIDVKNIVLFDTQKLLTTLSLLPAASTPPTGHEES